MHEGEKHKKPKKKRGEYGGGGPPPAAVDPGSQPIGVGRDHVVETQDAFGQVAVSQKPRYFTGDQREIPASLGVEDRADTKYRLKALGLMSKSSRSPLGVWDDDAANAFKEVLAWANARGVTWEEALEDMEDSATAYGAEEEEGSSRLPLTVELDHPDSVKRLMRETAKEKLGKGAIGDAALDGTVSRWHAQQRAAQTSAYNTAETGGTVTGAPDFETFAETEAQRIDPVGFNAHKVLDKFGVLLETLGGGS